MKKVLALDIDGTLTDSKKNITDNTLAALKSACDRGCKIVLASGRPTPGLNRYKNELELEKRGGYLLSFNGARLTDCVTGDEIASQTLPYGAVRKIHDYVKDMPVGMVTYDSDEVLTDSVIDEYMELEARINGLPIKQVDNLAEYVDFPVNKCLLTAPDKVAYEVMLKLQEEFGEEFSIYRSEPFFVEIMPKNVDKAATLQKLCDYLGITKDDLVACGDGYNDVSMIKFAGVGVAMGNAKPEVKEVADVITGTNDEDGLVDIVNKYFL